MQAVELGGLNLTGSALWSDCARVLQRELAGRQVASRSLARGRYAGAPLRGTADLRVGQGAFRSAPPGTTKSACPASRCLGQRRRVQAVAYEAANATQAPSRVEPQDLNDGDRAFPAQGTRRVSPRGRGHKPTASRPPIPGWRECLPAPQPYESGLVSAAPRRNAPRIRGAPVS